MFSNKYIKKTKIINHNIKKNNMHYDYKIYNVCETIDLDYFSIDIITKKIYINIYLCHIDGIIRNTKFKIEPKYFINYEIILILTTLFVIGCVCYFGN